MRHLVRGEHCSHGSYWRFYFKKNPLDTPAIIGIIFIIIGVVIMNVFSNITTH